MDSPMKLEMRGEEAAGVNKRPSLQQRELSRVLMIKIVHQNLNVLFLMIIFHINLGQL